MLLKFYKDGKRVDKEYKGHDSNNLGHIPFEDGTKESTLQTFKEALQNHSINIEFNSEVESVKKEGGDFIVDTVKNLMELKNKRDQQQTKPQKETYKRLIQIEDKKLDGLISKLYGAENCRREDLNEE